jgi:serine protease inhibitor ecotin
MDLKITQPVTLPLPVLDMYSMDKVPLKDLNIVPIKQLKDTDLIHRILQSIITNTIDGAWGVDDRIVILDVDNTFYLYMACDGDFKGAMLKASMLGREFIKRYKKHLFYLSELYILFD